MKGYEGIGARLIQLWNGGAITSSWGNPLVGLIPAVLHPFKNHPRCMYL